MNKTTLFRIAFRVLPLVPRTLTQYLAILASWVLWALAPALRQRVRANLAHFPELAAHPRRLDRTVRRSFRALLLNYVDLFAPPHPGDPDFVTHFPLTGLALYHQARAARPGLGCIVLSVHTAGFEWGRHRLPIFLSGPVIAPMETLTPPDFNDLLLTERNKSGMHFMPITEGETLRAMIASLRQGRDVLLALDRDVLHSGVVMPLLGAPARIPTGAISLARLTGAPILLAVPWRTGRNTYVGDIVALPNTITAQTRGDAAVRAALEPLVRIMETQLAKHPEQWLATFTDDVWLVERPVAVQLTAEVHST